MCNVMKRNHECKSHMINTKCSSDLDSDGIITESSLTTKQRIRNMAGCVFVLSKLQCKLL